MHPVDIYAPTPEDTLDLQELGLYRLIVEHRVEHGLPAIKLSHALTVVAGRHVLDTVRDFDPAGGDRLSPPGPVAGTATPPDGHIALHHARGEIHLLGVAPEHRDPAGWLATA